MDSNTLVDDKNIAGRELTGQLNRDEYDFRAVFWVKRTEDEAWYLYIVTPLVETEGTSKAYSLLQDSLNRMADTFLSINDIRLIGVEDPIAKDVMNIVSRPSVISTPLGDYRHSYGGRLGDMPFLEAHIYPRSFRFTPAVVPMSKEEILKELVHLMDRGPGPLRASTVALRDGSTFRGVPFSCQMGSDQAITAQFIIDGEFVPRIVRVEEIASVQ